MGLFHSEPLLNVEIKKVVTFHELFCAGAYLLRVYSHFISSCSSKSNKVIVVVDVIAAAAAAVVVVVVVVVVVDVVLVEVRGPFHK
ncbi:hypothetical protein ElyMa_004882000 [Elysia marginata]|uniref:Transmembrane protein n=1 Tax=Elysia marginata TaxID=1093978 RepID=A0AAV4IVB6_9GAST|nr:hypothetical protein ElyMa_004882000 [Elysia marginata]